MPPSVTVAVVLVSRDEAYTQRRLIMVAPVSTRIRNIPAELRLGPDDGLPRPCAANFDTITTVGRTRLEGLAGALSASKLAAMDNALRYAVGLR